MTIRLFTILIGLSLSLSAGDMFAKGKTKRSAKKKRTPESEFYRLKKEFRKGKVGERRMWSELGKIHRYSKTMSQKSRASLLQTQSYMLYNADYPILASIYASQAISLSKDHDANVLNRSWEILRRVSEDQPIQNLLEVLAAKIDLKKGEAPSFGTDWNYFVGNAALKKGDRDTAVKHYKRIKLSDRYFFPGKYQQALIHYDQKDLNESLISLKAILNPVSQSRSPLALDDKLMITDSARMALARIFYEKKEFKNAIKLYRTVEKGSREYYDSLFEQSWAFFMAGYPNHALGALHAVESPFFEEVFNPEATVLRSIIHYWLCRYNDSRNALADFMDNHAKGVEQLGEFLDRSRLTAETSYQLFENLVSGVSEKTLGIPRDVLSTAAEKDSMLLVRDQYASIIEEQRRLEKKGIFGTKKGLETPKKYLEKWKLALRVDVGTNFLNELKALQADYDRLYDQAQFLYVELLMSEKEQLLGKELHATSKINNVTNVDKIRGWGKKTQAWAGSKKDEYWWDEVGFYIYRVDSMCELGQ